jgi:hypothetical protein
VADSLVRQKLTRDQVAIIVGKEDGQPQRIRAFEDLLASIITDPVEVVTSPVSGDTTYTISNVIGFQSILIREANLVASAGGPFILTLTTGVGTVVEVPIAAFGDTITSGDLLFDVYVDSSGNLIAKDWGISGNNSNGRYQIGSDGSLSAQALLNDGTSLQTWTFPVPFVGPNPRVVPAPQATTLPRGVTWGNISLTSVETEAFNTTTGVATTTPRSVTADGRWRT